MRAGVARRRDRLELGVAELDDLAVGERVMLELDARARGQVGGRAGALDERGSPETWSACTCVSKHGDDRDALRLGERDVVVDQVDVRIDDRELAAALAAEQVGGAGRLVVEQLSEEHVASVRIGLTSYQLIS